jgi:hypothetical protein
MPLEILALQRRATCRGHEIRVQKTSLVHRMQYSLTIDGVKHDQLDALGGTFSLHGVLKEADAVLAVEIIVRQGFFTGTYECRVDGTPLPLERIRYGRR